MSEKVLFSIEGHIGYITLNRPDKLNALNQEIWEGLDLCLDKAGKESELRVIILKGEGRSFCSGLDLSPGNQLFTTLSGGSSAENNTIMFHHIRKLQYTFSGLERIHVPVIAAVHGHCLGGGLELILACDFRLASSDAIFSIPEVQLAIIADLGGTQRLPRIIGPGMARELLYTGRRFTAEEAKEMKLINHVYPDKDSLFKKAREMAENIADNAPLAVQGAKEVMNYSDRVSIDEGLEYVASRSSGILLSEDVMEAFQAYAQKRKPEFKGK